MRFESHFMKLMRRTENQRGALLALENPKQRVVGMAILERLDTFYEQHVATLSFRVCPDYLQQASELLEASAQRARELSIKILNIYIAECDDEQKELVKAAGFSEEARLRDRLRDGNEWMDLLIYTLSLPDSPGPLRSQGDYYGGRKQWQAERVASSGRDQYQT
jgi:RimJ/RimL family protein N-acetyltransferase